MSLVSYLDAVKTNSSMKLVFVLVMSLFLSACGVGAGEEDALSNASDVDSQTPTEEEDQNPVEVSAVQISAHPQSLTIEEGDNAIFTTSASGGGTLSFQWRKDEQNIVGATGSSLVLVNVSEADAALYDVVVSNSAGSQYSLAALLSVNTPVIVVPTVDPVVIVSQPQALTVDESTSASFSVQVTGDGEISYQWLKDGQTINGATAASFSINPVSLSDAASYRVRVTNSEGSVLSNSVALTVIALPEPVVIITQPQSITVDENASAGFSVEVIGDGEISYQWLKDGGIIEGEDLSTLSLSSVTSSDAASYSVIVTGSDGPVLSDVANLVVTVVQVVSSIELTWDIPEAREDGSDLSLGEINGYVIVYGTDINNLANELVVEGASNTSTQLLDLASGTYYFAIATVDSDGVQGAYSGVIQQSI
jgi:hypothetical protein